MNEFKEFIRSLNLIKRIRGGLIFFLCLALLTGEVPLYQPLVNSFAIASDQTDTVAESQEAATQNQDSSTGEVPNSGDTASEGKDAGTITDSVQTNSGAGTITDSVQTNSGAGTITDSVQTNSGAGTITDSVQTGSGTDTATVPGQGGTDIDAAVDSGENTGGSVSHNDINGRAPGNGNTVDNDTVQDNLEIISGNDTTSDEEALDDFSVSNNELESVSANSVSGNSVSGNSISKNSLTVSRNYLSSAGFTPPTIPGYTHFKESEVHLVRLYLIVSVDSAGNVYALYPSDNGLRHNASNTVPGNVVGNTVRLDVSGSQVKAYKPDNTEVDILECEWFFRGQKGRAIPGISDAMIGKFTIRGMYGHYLSLAQNHTGGAGFMSMNPMDLWVRTDFPSPNTPTVGSAYIIRNWNTNTDDMAYGTTNRPTSSRTLAFNAQNDTATSTQTTNSNGLINPSFTGFFGPNVKVSSSNNNDTGNFTDVQSKIFLYYRTDFMDTVNTGGDVRWLQKVVDEAQAQGFDSQSYDNATWQAYQTALNDAKNAITNRASTNQDAIDQYRVALEEAMKQLTRRLPDIGSSSLNKTYDGTAVSTSSLTVNKYGRTGAVSYEFYDSAGNTKLNAAPINAGDYNLVVVVAADGAFAEARSERIPFTIAKKDLSVAGAAIAPKSNDGTTTATVTGVTFSGFENGESFTINTDYRATGEFNSADPNTADSVSVTVTLIPSGKTNNYNLIDNPKDVPAAITQNTVLTGSLNKVYDGVAMAAVPTTIVGTTFAIETYGRTGAITYKYYSDAGGTSEITSPVNAGTYWVRAFVAGDSSYPADTSNLLEFTIRKREITPVSADIAARVYDGTNTAAINGVAFQTVPATAVLARGTHYTATGTYASADVQSSSPVTVRVQLTSEGEKNYILQKDEFTQPAGISARPITITGATVLPKSADGTNTANVTSVTFGGNDRALQLGTDYEINAVYNTNDPNTANKIIINIRMLTPNYYVTNLPYEVQATITPNTLLSGSLDKVYDGAPIPADLTAVSGFSINKYGRTGAVTYKYYTNAACTDEIQAPAAAGNYWVKAFVEAAGNYPDDESNAFAFTITRRELTIRDAEISAKTYDGTTASEITGITFGGLVSSDTLTINQHYTVTGNFNSADVKDASQVDVVVVPIVGNWNDNYVLNVTTFSKAQTIQPKPIKVGTVSVASKNYDGNRDATIDSVALVDMQSVAVNLTLGQDYSVSAQFADETAGVNKTVNITVALGPSDQSHNYVMSPAAATGTASIFENVSIRTVANKIYDGNAIDPEDTALFAIDKGARTVTPVFEYSNDNTFAATFGAPKDAGSYWVRMRVAKDATYPESVSEPVQFTIDRKNIRITEAAITPKIYDGNTDADVTGIVFDAVVTGEDFEKDIDYVINSAAFNSKDVAHADKVDLAVSLIDNAKTRNYNLITTTFEKAATIEPKEIQISAATIVPKSNDGNDVAEVASVSFRVLETGDVLTLGNDYTATGQFAAATVGISQEVTITVALTQTLTARNYRLKATAFIIQETITENVQITPVGGMDKVYDGEPASAEAARADGKLTIDVHGRPGDISYSYFADTAGTVPLQTAPVAAGDYSVRVIIGAKDNWPENISDPMPFTIEKAPLTIQRAEIAPKTYDTTTASTVTNVVFDGFVKDEAFTMNTDYTVTSAFNDANVANADRVNLKVVLKGNALTHNYTLTNPDFVQKNVSINKAEITIKDVAIAGKTASTTDLSANVLGVTFDGLKGSDSLAITVDYKATGSFKDGDPSAPDNEVTVEVELTDSTLAQNYNLNQKTFVQAASVYEVPTIVGSLSKVYDGAAVNAQVNLTVDKKGRTGNVAWTYYSDSAGQNIIAAPKDAGTYYVKATVAADGTFTSDDDTPVVAFTISQAEITIQDVTIDRKSYDSNTDATVSAVAFTGVISGETLRVTDDYTTIAEFNSPNVEDADTVTVEVTLVADGPVAKNYRITNPVYHKQQGIEKKQITIVAATIKPKSNDGTDAAIVESVTFTGEINQGELQFGHDFSANGKFAGTAVGTPQEVTITVQLANTTLANNYQVAGTYSLPNQTITENIVLAIVGDGLSKVYDGRPAIAEEAVNDGKLTLDLNGRNDGDIRYEYYNDSLGVQTLAEAPTKVGNYWVRVFVEDSPTWPDNQSDLIEFTISRRKLDVVTADVKAKTYDGSTAAVINQVSFSDIVTGETFIQGVDYDVVASFNNANVKDANSVNVSVILKNTARTANYYLDKQVIDIAAAIKPKEITITDATIVPKSNDGSKDAHVTDVQFRGTLNNELDLAVDYEAVGVFANTSAGTKKTVTVTVNMLGTIDGSNYLPKPNTFNLVNQEIKENTSLTGSADKIYDGKEVDESKFKINTYGRDGQVSLKYYTDANCMTELTTGKPQNAGVYWVKAVVEQGTIWPRNESAPVMLTISKAPLTIRNFDYDDLREYNGDTDGTINKVFFNGLVDNQTLDKDTDYTVTAAYNSADVDYANKIAASLILLPNAKTDNYYLTAAVYERSAYIIPKSITIVNTGTTADSKVYDGTTDAAVNNVSITGMIAGQNLVMGRDYTAKGTFDSKNVKEVSKVTITVVTQDTTLARNYDFTNTSIVVTNNISITPKTISIWDAVVQNKTYDGDIDSVVLDVLLNGIVYGDTLTRGTDYMVSGVFDNAGPATAIPVTVTVDLTATISAGNYQFAGNTYTSHADIASQTSLTNPPDGNNTGGVFGSAMDKYYDGKAANPSLLSLNTNGRPGKVTYEYYSDAALQNKLTSPPRDAAAYYVCAVIGATKNWPEDRSAPLMFTIHKAPLTITGAAIQEKTYDGTTAAAITGVTFKGLAAGERLVQGKDYTASGTYTSAKASVQNTVKVLVKLLGTDILKNYELKVTTFNQPAVIKGISSGGNGGNGGDGGDGGDVIPPPPPAPVVVEIQPKPVVEEVEPKPVKIKEVMPDEDIQADEPRVETDEENAAETVPPVLSWYGQKDGSVTGGEVPVTDANGRSYTLVYDMIQSENEEDIWRVIEENEEVRGKLEDLNNHQMIDIWLKEVETGLKVDPSGSVSFIIPFPEGTDETFTFTITNVQNSGESYILTKEIEYTIVSEGFLITADSLDSYVVSWKTIAREEEGFRLQAWQVLLLILLVLLLLWIFWLLLARKKKKEEESKAEDESRINLIN